MTLSLPKHKIRVLLLEGVNDSAVRLFEANGYSEVERLTKALGPEDLKQALSGVHMLGIRSRTQLTAEVMEAADRLLVVGCFSVRCSTRRIPTPAAWPN
jgi:D-3-phosphoglycerate dehydrogenase